MSLEATSDRVPLHVDQVSRYACIHEHNHHQFVQSVEVATTRYLGPYASVDDSVALRLIGLRAPRLSVVGYGKPAPNCGNREAVRALSAFHSASVSQYGTEDSGCTEHRTLWQEFAQICWFTGDHWH